MCDWGHVRDTSHAVRRSRSVRIALAALPKADPAAGSALKSEFEGLLRLRVGHFRVVYEWQRSELLFLVMRIGHRRKAYR